MGDKASKTEVNYRKGTPSHNCGLCAKFRPPHGCIGVVGKIYADDICDRFIRKLARSKT